MIKMTTRVPTPMNMSPLQGPNDIWHSPEPAHKWRGQTGKVSGVCPYRRAATRRPGCLVLDAKLGYKPEDFEHAARTVGEIRDS